MTLLELTQSILKTHAETLTRLAAFFGEEKCIEILENAGERSYLELKFLPADWFKHLALNQQNQKFSSAYQSLDGVVKDLHLSEPLEFHLWSYPPYRMIVESSIRLESKIISSHADSIIKLFFDESKRWFDHLDIKEPLQTPARSAAVTPWIRFKAETFKKMGLRPFSLL